MDEEACPTCGTPYVVFRDIENKRWRYLCACEANAGCAKGRHPATHAKLHVDDSVERYVCDAHGVPPDERPPPPPRTSIPAKEAPKRRTEVPKPSRVRRDLLTLEGFKAELRESQLRGRCKKCRRDRAMIDSQFKAVEGTPLFDLLCPFCGHHEHDFL